MSGVHPQPWAVRQIDFRADRRTVEPTEDFSSLVTQGVTILGSNRSLRPGDPALKSQPTPLSLPPVRRPAPTGAPEQQPTRLLECLPCGRLTPHVRGETTQVVEGSVTIQWWKCTLCDEGEAL